MERLALNLKEAAEAASVSEPTMRALVMLEDFPAIRIGRRWVIPVESLNAWLIAQAAGRASLGNLGE